MCNDAVTVDAPNANPEVLEELTHLRATYEGVHTNALRNSDLGHWINEAFIVRLFALLEAHSVVGSSKSIDYSIAGAKDVDLSRRLRHKITHSLAMVGSSDSRKLDQELRLHYGLGGKRNIVEDKYILSKDTVLRPMYSACFGYCQAVIEKEHAKSDPSSEVWEE